MASSAHEQFLALHRGPAAFVMPNVWDGASALMMRAAGFAAIGSSSFAYGATRGLPDVSIRLGRSESIAHAAWLGEIAKLPVNGDLADGFGPAPEDCAATVEASIAAGLAGLGIEDATGDSAAPIHDFDAAVSRIRAAARAAQGRIVLTARADNFLCGRADLDDTIRRLTAFAEAGADVLYAPGLPDMDFDPPRCPRRGAEAGQRADRPRGFARRPRSGRRAADQSRRGALPGRHGRAGALRRVPARGRSPRRSRGRDAWQGPATAARDLIAPRRAAPRKGRSGVRRLGIAGTVPVGCE